jgi:cytochrome b involved in lipid metabolism
MKKLITISLFIFWAIVVAILTAGLIFYQNSKNIISNNSKNIFTMNSSNNSLATGSTNDQNATSATNQSSQSLSLSLSEIAKHSTPSDCWLLISNKVYNVSSFIAAHPGGSGTIIPNCGKDSTQAYNTKGGNSSHSANATAMLRDYYIGDLNQQTSQQQIQQNVQNTNMVPPPAGGEEEEEEDD